ncbi:transketolase family protein [Propionicicella superfundia]|uniref:transketolase family protein n=1 Tax=Propionicicella superfundia TaxID=348582 RepID=UPI0004176205|nr:transketolase C-terminal domain-containing protein [Propionicicella superfundia]
MIGDRHDPRKTFGAAVSEIAATDERIVILSADSGGSSGFGTFMKEHPERYFEFGIQEQGVTGVASGLATTGKIPVFCAIAPFVTLRNFEQFRNDLGYMRQNVKIVGRNGGFTYADLGSTHHSLEDYAVTRMIPGVTVLAPMDPDDMRGAVKAMLAHEGPVYMRIGNAPIPEIAEPAEFVIGKARLLREGSAVTVVTTGYVAADVLEAADALRTSGVDVELLGLGTAWPLDEEAILASAAKTGHVITVEEHYEVGGLGGAVAELLSGNAVAPLDRIAVPQSYVPTGPYAEIQQSLGLDAASLQRRIAELVATRKG